MLHDPSIKSEFEAMELLTSEGIERGRCRVEQLLQEPNLDERRVEDLNALFQYFSDVTFLECAPESEDARSSQWWTD
jgi:hypothetical protein